MIVFNRSTSFDKKTKRIRFNANKTAIKTKNKCVQENMLTPKRLLCYPTYLKVARDRTSSKRGNINYTILFRFVYKFIYIFINNYF